MSAYKDVGQLEAPHWVWLGVRTPLYAMTNAQPPDDLAISLYIYVHDLLNWHIRCILEL